MVETHLVIPSEAWAAVVRHAEETYPKECCGVLIGDDEGGRRLVREALACRNAYEGDQKDRFLIHPDDQLAAQKRARTAGLDVLGFYHSHPDEAAYFSSTDLKNSWPVYSNLVVSVMNGQVRGAAAFRADAAQTVATPETLDYPLKGDN